jgi:CDP-diacylglycerol---glycerol-3-phosphate 3-phosphatidyltransferase
MTLADQVTLARLGLMPVIVAAYLLIPAPLCLWIVGWMCALAEYTDLLDGRIARRRGEVSDFGKLADPFCDVIYRIGVFLAFLLPAGIASSHPAFAVSMDDGGPGLTLAQIPGQMVHVHGDHLLYAGLVPWLPVFLMVLREIIAGALRAMTATKGLVLAARTSGKVKAWLQGTAIITIVAFPAVFFAQERWMLVWAWWATWICAIVSVLSIIEYIWVNRGVLGQLIERKTAS